MEQLQVLSKVCYFLRIQELLAASNILGIGILCPMGTSWRWKDYFMEHPASQTFSQFWNLQATGELHWEAARICLRRTAHATTHRTSK
jgi:hypothetical protein